MKTICKRLHRGDDLLDEIRVAAQENSIHAGVILSGVGCVSHARLRDASGVAVRELDEPCEIVSLGGTVSAVRCHVHAAISKEDLSMVGGHVLAGCIINTTCELVIGVLSNMTFGVEQDPATGYDELVLFGEDP